MIAVVGMLGMAVSIWRNWGEGYTMFLWFQTVALTVLVGSVMLRSTMTPGNAGLTCSPARGR